MSSRSFSRSTMSQGHLPCSTTSGRLYHDVMTLFPPVVNLALTVNDPYRTSQIFKSSSDAPLCSALAHLALIKSRACDAEMRADGKNLVKPLITGRRTFNSGSWTCLSNSCSNLDPESTPIPSSSISPLASSLSCSHFGRHTVGNSPTKSIIDATKTSILTH